MCVGGKFSLQPTKQSLVSELAEPHLTAYSEQICMNKAQIKKVISLFTLDANQLKPIQLDVERVSSAFNGIT